MWPVPWGATQEQSVQNSFCWLLREIFLFSFSKSPLKSVKHDKQLVPWAFFSPLLRAAELYLKMEGDYKM